MKKTRSRKSRDTVPLKGLSPEMDWLKDDFSVWKLHLGCSEKDVKCLLLLEFFQDFKGFLSNKVQPVRALSQHHVND